MIGPVIALAAIVAARILYPRRLQQNALRVHPLDAEGIVIGGGPIDIPRSNAPAVLLLHGAGDTPQVLEDLARHLHARGFAVRAPLLPGHGRRLTDWASTSAAAWFTDAQRHFDELRARHEHVAVVGLSMGGALGVRLAAERRDVAALVLLAPYVAIPAYLRRLADTTRWWGWLFPYVSSRGQSSIRDPEARQRALGYRLFTPGAIAALSETVARASRALEDVRCPTLVIHSREDNRIRTGDAQLAYDRLGAQEKKLVWLENTGHVITVDYGHETVFDATTEWIETHVGPPTHRPTSQ